MTQLSFCLLENIVFSMTICFTLSSNNEFLVHSFDQEKLLSSVTEDSLISSSEGTLYLLVERFKLICVYSEF